MNSVPAILVIPGNRIQIVAPDVEVRLTLFPAPGGILPFRIGRQPIGFSRQGTQFLEKQLGGIPAHVLDGTPRAVPEFARIFAHHRLPQFLGHLILADLESLHLYLTDRHFVIVATALFLRTAHRERAALDGDHLLLEVFQ